MFHREAKIMLWLFILVLVVGFLAAMLVPRVITFIEVDRYLGAGGTFNYEKRSCEK